MGRKLLNGIFSWSGHLAGVCLVLMLGITLARSIGRAIGINIPAGDEFVAYLMAAATFLGLAYTFKSGEMLRVVQVVDMAKGNLRSWIEMSLLAVSFLFLAYFAWHAGWFTYYSWLYNERAQGVVPVPLWIPQCTFAGGLALLALAFADEFVRVALRHGKPAPGETRPEADPIQDSSNEDTRHAGHI